MVCVKATTHFNLSYTFKTSLLLSLLRLPPLLSLSCPASHTFRLRLLNLFVPSEHPVTPQFHLILGRGHQHIILLCHIINLGGRQLKLFSQVLVLFKHLDHPFLHLFLLLGLLLFGLPGH
jgi:hypothetical protein